MSDNIEYYYWRMMENFFKDKRMRALEGMENGYIYIIILQKIYNESLRDRGRLRISEKIPCTPESLVDITGHKLEHIQKALPILCDLEYIEILENGTIYALEIQNYIGKSSTEADRKREYRQRIDAEKEQIIAEMGQMSQESQTFVPKNGTNVLKSVGHLSSKPLDKCPPELELELELELEKNKSKNNNKSDKNSEKKISKTKIVDNFDNFVDNSSKQKSENKTDPGSGSNSKSKSKKNLWDQILSQMQEQVNPSAYNSWLSNTKLIGVSETNNIITVKVKDEVAKKKIENEYAFDLTTIAEKITGGLYEFKFSI